MMDINESVAELYRIEDTITKRRLVEAIVTLMDNAGMSGEWLQEVDSLMEEKRDSINQ